MLDQVEPEAFLADKGYDSDALIETLKERGITPVIPSKANRREARRTDFALYRERNLVEGDPGLSIRFLRPLASMPSPSRPSMRCAPNSMLSVKQIEDIPPHLRLEG